MSYITKYGTLWGTVPHTTGRVFWVAPSAAYTVEGRTFSASNDNDGLSPERALLTVNRAVALATADVGDVIMLLPGSHSWSATQTIDKAGLTILGIAGGPLNDHERGTRTTRYMSAVTTTASAAVFTVSAARTEIAYIHIVPASAQAGISLAAADINAHDITWNISTAANTATFGISISGASARPRLSNFYVYVSDNQGPFLRCASATGSLAGGVLQRSTIVLDGTTAWDDAIEITTGVDNFCIRDVDFVHSSGAIMTDVIDVTGNTNDHGVTIMRCYFPVASDPTQESATSDIALANNYLAQIQGASGGILVA